MRFQMNRTPVLGILLSLCSLNAIADDSASQGSSLGAALGSLLNGYLNGVKQPTNSDSSATTESSTQEQFNHTAPMNAEDQAYMAKGLWHDPSTGLIWNLCRIGETWNGSDCIGNPTQFDWPHAMLAARDARLDGHNDWRVPSMSEYVGIIRCSTGFDDPMYGQPLYDMANDASNLQVLECRRDQNQNRPLHILPDHFKFDVGYSGSFNEWSSSYKLNQYKTQYFPKAYNGSEIPTTPYKIRLVRGANSSNSSTFSQALQITDTVLKLPALRANEAKARQNDLSRKTANLRQNVKEGDRTAQGLVIQVKGNLVKMQTYKRVCTMMTTAQNPVCVTSHIEVGGEEWVNRNNLTPVQ